MSSTIRIEQKGARREIWLDRESALNALNSEMLAALKAELSNLSAEFEAGKLFATTRLIVLRGTGKAFVAGADIKEMQGGTPAQNKSFADLGQGVMSALENLPLPTVALVDGFALGGGMELALACDLIVATEKARFGQPEVALGLIPGFGGTQRIVHRAGAGTAKRLIFLGETISADEAYRLGIVDRLIESSAAETFIEELTQTISKKGPLAINAAKAAIEAAQAEKKAGLEFEQERFIGCFKTADTKEGLVAFLEKRPPNFKGS
jgi:enoyl-CoA hydratase